MKSRVIKMFPYRQVDLTRYKMKPDIDKAQLQKELERAAYPYITWSEGGSLAAGDVAECGIKSAVGRLDRPRIQLTVGAGLLDPALEAELPFVNIVKVNTTEQPRLWERFDIHAVPTVHFYQDGELKDAHIGAIPPEKLREIVSGYMYG